MVSRELLDLAILNSGLQNHCEIVQGVGRAALTRVMSVQIGLATSVCRRKNP